ncbi:hypothetical protein AMTR_s00134p00114540 [Amborella trichopoda]|uniref:Uncharacterized protein n=1 Tax=Amborella trichopoda TaxID=13333 RepID=W1P4Y1_AMBTC|nr:hypothetical protein AMTR_s00134p00114540 [Amborella trichopoda]
MAEEERDSIRDELKRVRAELDRNSSRDRCHELLEDVKGLIDKSGKMFMLLLAAGGNLSLADVNPYVRVSLPSSARSQSQSQASTRMTRDLRWVRQRLEGEESVRTPVVEKDSGSRM